tara:strand:- start:85 stop:711 length:627 start_codon:yes stop_codon:yes gene_type:complete
MKSLLNLDDFEQFESVIFFDLEFTCWEDNNISNNWEDVLRPPEIIQIGFAWYDKINHHIKNVFSSYVKPKDNPVLSNYCKKLLNIDNDQIKNSPNLIDVVTNLSNWLDQIPESYVFSSWGVEDYLIMVDNCDRSNIPNPLKDIDYIDLMRISHKMIGIDDSKYYDREEVKKYLKIYEKDHNHEALQDAIDLKSILVGLQNKFGKVITV